jgi:hypothetical protein
MERPVLGRVEEYRINKSGQHFKKMKKNTENSRLRI